MCTPGGSLHLLSRYVCCDLFFKLTPEWRERMFIRNCVKWLCLAYEYALFVERALIKINGGCFILRFIVLMCILFEFV